MKRKDVKTEYIWKLEDIFESDESWNEELNAFCRDMTAISDYKGRLKDDGTLLEALRLSDELETRLERLYAYAHMRRDENSATDKYVGACDRVDNAEARYSALCSFMTSEISEMDETELNRLAASEEFSDYSYMLGEIARKKKHVLSEKEEKLLASASLVTGTFEDIFGKIDYIDLPLPKITTGDGRRVQLTQGTYSLLLQSQDPITRRRAFNGLYKTYEKLINTLAATYVGSVRSDNFFAFARGYEGALGAALFSGNIPSEVYDNLLAAVGDGTKTLHDYVLFRKRAMGVKKLHMYDMYVSLVKGIDKNYEYEEAFEIVLRGLAPMGEEYVGLLKKAKDERWIDVYETENKRSGAYSWGCAGVHPFVLLNHTGTTHDVFTIAHELGHSLHSYYSSATQPYAKAHYSIFVAEVASTVNEVLLLKHLIGTASTREERMYYLNYYLEMFRTTLFRQTMFAEFEKISHDMASNDRPLTPETLSEAYYELNRKYYGDAVEHDKLIRYEWARIPHFYSAFYVYKYATGITAAVNIANAILSGEDGALDRYKRFLSAGGSKSSYEILCDAGVDLRDKKPYEVAMREFADTLDALKKEFETV